MNKYDHLVMDTFPLLSDIITGAIGSFNYWTDCVAEYKGMGTSLEFMVWFSKGSKEQNLILYKSVCKSIDEGKY